MQSVAFKNGEDDKSFPLNIDNCPVAFNLAQSAVNFAQQHLKECKVRTCDRIMIGFIASLPNALEISSGFDAQMNDSDDHWIIRVDGNKASASNRDGVTMLPTAQATAPVKPVHQFKDIEVKCSFAQGVLSVDDNGRIVNAPPIFRKFIARPYKALTHWLDKKGGYTESVIDPNFGRSVEVQHGS